MLVPERMKDFARDLPDDVGRKYDWGRPPVPPGPTAVVKSYLEVQRLIAQPTIYKPSAEQRLEILTGGVHLEFASVRHPPYTGHRFT